MGKITVFANQKGGVGKTTVCVNVGACLAKRGKRVLIVDLDPQGNATTGLGHDKSQLLGSLYNVLISGSDAQLFLLKTCVDGLFILPSSIDLAGAEVELAFVKNREKCLKSALIGLKDYFDNILIDCPPSLGLLTVNALVAADLLIIPMQSEFYSLEGASQLINTARLVSERFNPSLSIDGVILSMYSDRSLVSRQIAQQIHEHFKDKVFKTTLPRSVRVAEAPSYGRPVTVHSPECAATKAFEALTDEILRLYI